MKNEIDLRKLRPSEIVGIKMNPNRILLIWFNYPIIDSKKDYEVALYIAKKKAGFEKAKGKCLGLFVDLSNYIRLDCVGFLDITVPSLKARQLHTKMHKDAILKRVAFYKKNASLIGITAVKMAAIYYNKKVRLFNDRANALKWLEEGVRLSL